MLDDLEKEMLFEELQDKFLQLEQKIEELENDSDESGDSEAADPLSEGVTGDANFDLPFRVHWFGFESADECDEIDTVIKAQEVLIQKTEEKNNDARRARVSSGDVMVLLCNHGPTTGDEDEEDEDSSGSEDEDEKPKMFTDACYYVGLVVNTRVAGQTIFQDDASDGPQFGAHTDNYSIIVWETCGKAGLSCPDKPKAIKIDEIVFPEDDGSLAEDPKYGLTASQQAEFRELAVTYEYKTFKLEKEEPESPPDPNEPIDDYGLFKNVEQTQKRTGALFEFSDIFNHSIHKYNAKAEAYRVSINAADMSAKLESYSPIEVEVTTVSIMSDKCGSLKKETAEEGEPAEPLIQKKTLLVGNDIDGSEEFNLSALVDYPESGYSVSLGNALEVGILDKTDTQVVDGNDEKLYFVPRFDNTADAENIKVEDTFDVIEDFKVGVTIVSKNETDEDGNEKLCSEITIKPEKKVKKLTFHSGLLTKSEPESPQWEAAGAEKKFLAAMCEEEGDCKTSYMVSGPENLSATVPCIDPNATHVHPDCCTEFYWEEFVPDPSASEDDPNFEILGTTKAIRVLNLLHGKAKVYGHSSAALYNSDPDIAWDFYLTDWMAEKDIEIGAGASLSGNYEVVWSNTIIDGGPQEPDLLVGNTVTVN
jgi:hypothetical protein